MIEQRELQAYLNQYPLTEFTFLETENGYSLECKNQNQLLTLYTQRKEKRYFTKIQTGINFLKKLNIKECHLILRT